MQQPRQPFTKPNILNTQSGFTLIEIIAVLVILSILAVVAVPKYFDLQTEAQNKALEGALAEAVGRVNSNFAKNLLGGTAYDAVTYSTNADTSLGEDLGDFTLNVLSAQTTSGIQLKVLGNTGTAVAGASLTRTIPWPGKP
jgi:prepilin-type N-terminal cleavage/methylation domain-containing protein